MSSSVVRASARRVKESANLLRGIVDRGDMCIALFLSAGLGLFWTPGQAGGQPLNPAPLSCAAGSPNGNQVVPSLLSGLESPLNSAWTTQAPITIDPYPPGVDASGNPINLVKNDINIPCNSDFNEYCSLHFSGGNCKDAFGDVTMDSLTGLRHIAFANLASTLTFNFKDVAAHADRGPDGSRITDGVFAPEGHSSTDPVYAIVLPHSANDPRGALVIDFGATTAVCSSSTACANPPVIQADNDDVYQIDRYDDSSGTWLTVGRFENVSGSGLHTRPVTSTAAIYSTRYIRVYAVSGGNTFAVSELQLWNTSGKRISVGKRVVGPRPYQITDGVFAAEGHSSTDTLYAVVLRHETGPAPALIIDLGAVTTICGNGWDCLSEPLLQADNDDVYGFDYSSDGRSWTTYAGTFATVSTGSGLRKRTTQCSARPDPSEPCSKTNHGPNFKARYVRMYALSGGNTFAVSELQLWDIGSKLISVGAATYGPEPLATNGDVAPEGTDYDDTRYATILPSCHATSNSTCPDAASAAGSGQTTAVMVDLNEPFLIDHLAMQADQAHTFEVDGSLDGGDSRASWFPLWIVPEVSGHGLITRKSNFIGQQARYLRIFGTAGASASYSISSLQVYAAQANTPCGYDAAANAGQNFTCSYDGTFVPTVQLNGLNEPGTNILPVNFHFSSASIRVTCKRTDSGGQEHTETFTVSDAHDRHCSDFLPIVKQTPVADYCSGFCASGTPQAFLSYAQLHDPLEFEATNAASVVCEEQEDIDQGILPLMDSVVAGVASDASQGLLSGILQTGGKLVPFPPVTQPGVVACAALQSEPPPPGPYPDTLSGIDGRATKVGKGSGSATLHIEGRFTVQEPLALDQATVLVDALLREPGRPEDLVKGPDNAPLAPVNLLAGSGSKPDKGLYATPPAAKPRLRAQISRGTPSGVMEFTLDVDQVTIATPSLCTDGSSVVPLITSFLLAGGSDAPVWVHATVGWQCNGAELMTSLTH